MAHSSAGCGGATGPPPGGPQLPGLSRTGVPAEPTPLPAASGRRLPHRMRHAPQADALATAGRAAAPADRPAPPLCPLDGRRRACPAAARTEAEHLLVAARHAVPVRARRERLACRTGDRAAARGVHP